MNKSYKSVWNESTGTWVAASELTTGRSKSKRAKNAISKAILTQIAVGGMSLAGAGVAMADDTVKSGTGATVNIADGVAIGLNSQVDADSAHPTKIGGIAIGDSAYAIGSGVAIGQDTSAGSDSLALGSGATAANGGTAIGLNSYTINNGGLALGQNATVTGNGSLALGLNSQATSSGSVALGQDSVASRINTVSVGNATQQRQIVNVAAGSQATDAVNVGQLTAAGLVVNSTGGLSNSFVSYDSTAKDKVSLGGTAATKAVTLTNVASGVASSDAVNVGQLTAAGLNFNTTGGLTNSFVAYDSSAKDKVTFGGTAATKAVTLTNVAGGVANTDAVNVGQLKDAGLNFNTTGGVANAFVAYDSTAKSAITLGGGTDGTAIHNLATGKTSTDAVNLGQMNAAIAAVGTGGAGSPLAVSYDAADKTTVTLAGGTAGTLIHNVATGVANTDAANVGQVNAAISSSTASILDSQKYIKFGASTAMTASATGTDSMALGGNAFASATSSLAIGLNSRATGLNSVAIGVGSTTSVANTVSVGSTTLQRRITNVADGTADTDAATVGQLGELETSLTALKSQQAVQSQQPVQATRQLLGATPGLLGAQAFALTDVLAVGDTDKLKQTEALGVDSMAVGLNAHANNVQAVAIGTGVSAGGVSSFALGVDSLTRGTNSSAMGVNAQSIADGALALGYTSAAENTNSIAIGTNSLASSPVAGSANTVAIGSGATASGNGAVVIGSNSVASGTNTVVLGNNVFGTKAGKPALGNNSVVLGNASDGSQDNVVSVGGTATGTQRKIVNVAAGTTTTDAVNLGQMTAAIAAGAGSGNSVAYDSSAKDAITLAGSAGTQIHNVKAGSTSTDAVNIAQLTAAGLIVNSTGGVTNSFVAYDSTSKDKVTFGGTAATKAVTLSNVAAGATTTDAVNVGQLTAMGATIGTSGQITNAFVAYDSTAKDAITLGGGSAGTQIHNVKAGSTSTDAANIAQLTAAGLIVNSTGGVTNSFVAYDSTAKDKVTFGGTAATKAVTLSNVAAGTTTTDAVNVGQLAAMGATIGTSGQITNAFVAYDSTAKDVVTLGGASGTKITKLAAGAISSTSTDAINGSQLYITAASTAAALGGGSTVDSTGKVSAPTMTVGGTSYTNVAAAVDAAAKLAAAGSVDGVAYDSTTHDKVTFGGTAATKAVTLSNVADGVAGKDAVNVDQLKAMGATFGTSGGITNSFVSYDSTAENAITLGGSAGTQIHNLKAGTTSTDAVNLAQLTAMGAHVDSTGGVTNAFVAYDSTSEDKVTFGGTAATKAVKLANVAAGTTTTDAVNVGQLAAMGATIGTSGQITNAFVAYDSTAKDVVTLGGASGTKITKLVAGAVNATSTDAINGSQLYKTAASTAAALGGGSTVDGTGNVSAPTMTAGGTSYTNVAAAVDAAAAMAAAGSVNGVMYDSTAHDKVTFGGTAATKAVTLSNVADGVAGKDAVNVDQLKALGVTIGTSGGITNSFVAYDAGNLNSVTLAGGATGTQIHNVAAGTSAMDAVTSSTNTLSDALKYVRFGASTAMTASASATDSMAIGGNAFANANGALAIGLNARATGVNSVAIGVGSTTTPAQSNTVSVGNTTVQRRIVNVADGVADTDAATFGQVDALQTSVDAIQKSLQASQTPVKATRQLLGATAFGLTDVVAIGTTDKLGRAQALGTDAMALGLNANAINNGAVAIGTGVSAGGVDSFALGMNSLTSGTNSSAMGVNAQSIADGALAMGYTAAAENADAIAIGTNSLASSPTDKAANTVAIGTGATASGNGAVVIGSNSVASGTNTVVLGNNVFGTKAGKPALGSNSVVLGNASDGSQDNVVSVGGTAANTQRKIVNVAAGTTATDAVNLGQMTTAIAAVTTGGNPDGVVYNSSTHDKVTFGGTAATKAVTLSNVAAGVADTDAVNVSQLTAMGGKFDTSGHLTNAFVAYDSTAKDVITLGGASGTKITNLVAGAVSSTSKDAINGSQLYNTAASTAAALGSTVDSDGKVAAPTMTVGGKSYTNVAAAVDAAAALAGSGSVDGVVYDSSAHDKVTFGGTKAVTLSNVAAGVAGSDAVNVAQLQPVVEALGGGAKIDSTTGAVISPTYTIQGKTSKNVGDALSDVDGSLTKLTDAIAGGTPGGLVAQEAATQNITVGALTGGTVVDVTNNAGQQRTITGVAAGSLSESSFDAINGSQLNKIATGMSTAIGGGALFGTDGSITQPSFTVGTKTSHNVGDAISDLNDGFTDLSTKVKAIGTGGSGGVANPNAVAFDTDDHTKLTLGGTAGTTLVTGLTDGSLAAGSTDAVTGNQLYATNKSIDDLSASVLNISTTGSTSIGINGTNGADGAPGTPAASTATGSDAIAMGDKAKASGDHTIVIGGGASGTSDGAIAIGGNAGVSGKDSIAIGNNASAPADNAVALGANSVADRDNSVSVGAQGAERQITNVAAGTQGTDAVNLNQLNSATSGIARKAYSGIAAATALTMIPDVDANKTLSIGIGGGTFQGYAATAIGGTARITQNIKVRVGAGWSAAGTTVGAGASYQW